MTTLPANDAQVLKGVVAHEFLRCLKGHLELVEMHTELIRDLQTLTKRQAELIHALQERIAALEAS